MALTPQYVVDGLVRRGIPRNAAFAFAGNFVAESGLNPAINEIKPVVPGSRGGYGLAQWTGPRRRQLEAFAASRKMPVSDPDLQMDFLAWELQNTEKGAAQAIFSASDPTEAARLVSERFLRPGIPNMKKRLSATAEIAGGTFSSGAGAEVMSGGEGQDVLADDPLAGIDFDLLDRAAGVPQPQAVMPPTPEQAYKSTGALDLSDIDFDILDQAAAMSQPQGTDAITGLPMAMTPPRAEDAFTPTPPLASNLRGELSAPGFDAASQFGAAASEFGQVSPNNLPGAIASLPSRAMQAISGLSGAANYAVGGAADLAIAAGAPRGATQRLARDVAALPEAFAGSPQQATRIATAPRVPGQPVAAAARIEPPVTRMAPQVTQEQVQTLLRNAQGRGATSRAAIEELAKIAKVDPDAMAAAERLGIDLPVDVFTTSVPVREVAGAIRGAKTSEAASDWIASVETAQSRASEAIRQLDGGQSLSEVSAEVLTSLRGTRETLKAKADDLYKFVDGVVRRSATVQLPNTSAILSETIDELGGLSRLTDKERQLVAAITNEKEPLTYAGMVRMKQDIGRALERGQGPYADVNTATLKRLYGALAEDQLSAAESLGGADARKSLEVANGLVSQRKQLEERIVGAFGSEFDGSVASNLSNAIRQGSKGDITALNRVLAVIPEDLQGRAVASALTEVTRSKDGSNGGFSFANYAAVYRGLRNQPEVYSRIAKAIGPEGHQVLNDLYQVSNAVAKAQAAIPVTGKANQILQSGALAADGLITRVLNSTTGKTAIRATTTGAAGVMGGIPGAIAADSIGAAITKGKPDRLSAAGKLLASDEFKRLAVEVATKPQASEAAKRGVFFSRPFRAFVKSAGITNPEAWLNAAILGNIASQSDEGQQ